MTAPKHSFWCIWRMPVLLAVLTLFGLLAALLGIGIWHAAAWLAMLAPIVVSLWFALRPCRR